MTLLEAANQALEALNTAMPYFSSRQEPGYEIDKAMESLRQAIEQANKQEPVAWVYKCGGDVQINTLPPECYGGNWTRTPLYTAPLQREVEFLDDDEVIKLANEEGWNIQVENMPPNLLRIRVGALASVIQKEFWRKNT